MIYSEEVLSRKIEHESGIDVDWFACDSLGRIAMVASAGGMLPNTIVKQRESDFVYKYFRSLPKVSEVIHFTNDLERIIEDMSLEKRKLTVEGIDKDVRNVILKTVINIDFNKLESFYVNNVE